MAILYKSISVTSSGDNTLITGVAGHKYQVLNYTIVADGTVAVSFKSGSTLLSGAMALVANSGISAVGDRQCPQFETIPGDSFIINLSAAIGVRGHLTYIDTI